MRLLLDTHTFLWFVLGDSQLGANALRLILDPANTTFVSPASYWEIAIKINLGKYVLNEPYDDFMRRGIEDNGFRVPPTATRRLSRRCPCITATRLTDC